MTDYEFAELQREIQNTKEYLERLQKRHIKETGKRYSGIGMVKKRCAECGAEYHGDVCPVCHVVIIRRPPMVEHYETWITIEGQEIPHDQLTGGNYGKA